MSWKGPYDEGITQSIINRFLECPYRFYIYTILGLEEQQELHPNLVWGSIAHKGLEILIKNPKLSSDFTDSDWVEVDQAIDDLIDKDYPNCPPNYPISIKLMMREYDDSYKEEYKFLTEVVFEESYLHPVYGKVLLRGMADGLSLENEVLVEHKCKGKIDPLLSRLETPVDFQVQLYCLMLGPRKVIYDNIRIPDNQFFMPKRRIGEKFGYYVKSWYTEREHGDFPVQKNKHLWLNQHTTYQDDESLDNFVNFRLNPLISKICKWWEHVTQPGFDHNNPEFYNDVFYQVPIRHFNPSNTEKFKCNYHDFLTEAIAIEDLIPVKSYFSELEDD